MAPVSAPAHGLNEAFQRFLGLEMRGGELRDLLVELRVRLLAALALVASVPYSKPDRSVQTLIDSIQCAFVLVDCAVVVGYPYSLAFRLSFQGCRLGFRLSCQGCRLGLRASFLAGFRLHLRLANSLHFYFRVGLHV